MNRAAAASEPRTSVRVAFWTAVVVLWAPLAALVVFALSWGAAAAGLWQVPPLPENADSEAVVRAWGAPDKVFSDPSAIGRFFGDYDECPVRQASKVWVYNRLVLPDSVVFVGDRRQAVCAVRAKGTHIFVRTH